MNVVVEMARFRNTRLAVHVNVLEGPFTGSPGLNEDEVIDQAVGMAGAKLGEFGFEVVGAEPHGRELLEAFLARLERTGALAQRAADLRAAIDETLKESG